MNTMLIIGLLGIFAAFVSVLLDAPYHYVDVAAYVSFMTFLAWCTASAASYITGK